MILFIVILAAAFLAQLFLPWWVIIPICLAASFWRAKSAWKSFLIPLASIFLLWAATASYLSIQNDHILAGRVAQMFGLPISDAAWIWMVLLTAIPGAITAGFSGLSGFFLRKIVANN